MKLGAVTLPLQDHVKILGVNFDAELRFEDHIRHITHQASLRVSALRRLAGFLDKRGPGKALPGVWCPNIDLQRCNTPAEIRKGRAAGAATNRGQHLSSPYIRITCPGHTGAPPGRCCSSGASQDAGTGGAAPGRIEAPPASGYERHENGAL